MTTSPPGPYLMKAIRLVVAAQAKVPQSPPTWFDASEEAARHNSGLLQACHYDITRFLAKHQDSTLAFGSEFRPLEQLQTILGGHPTFPFYKDVLAQGIPFHFCQKLSEDQRLDKLDKMAARGNHKSAQNNEAKVKGLLRKNVLHGFLLPVDPANVGKLKGAMVQPVGFSLLEDGSQQKN
jgi:hypothetical protein